MFTRNKNNLKIIYLKFFAPCLTRIYRHNLTLLLRKKIIKTDEPREKTRAHDLINK